MGEVITNMKVRFGADTKQLKKGMDGGKQAVKQFGSHATGSLERMAQAFGINTAQINGALRSVNTTAGSLGKGFKGAAAGVGFFSRALKILKMVLISTGIGALVVALGSLIAYFTKTQRGADKVKKVMAGFKAILGVLVDRLSSFGEGLFKIFTGDFKGGWDTLKKAFKGVGDEMRNEAKAARDLAQREMELEDREISLIETQARRRKEIEKMRLIAKDEIHTAEARKKALLEAQRLDKQMLADEMSMQKERTDILEKQIALGESTRDDYRQLAEAKARMHELESESIRLQRRLVTEMNTVNNKIKAQTAALIKQREEAFKPYLELAKKLGEGQKAGAIDTTALASMRGNIDQKNQLSDSFINTAETIVDATASIEGALESSAAGFGEWIGALAAGNAGLKDLAGFMLNTMGDLAIQIGKIAIGVGITMTGIKKAFLNPYTAIAAGLALVALGTAVKSAVSNAMSGAASASVSGGGGGTGSFSYDTRGALPAAATQAINVNVTGEFRQRGTDLVAVVKKENNRRGLVT